MPTVHDYIKDIKEQIGLDEKDISRLYPKREDSGAYDQLKKSGWRKLHNEVVE